MYLFKLYDTKASKFLNNEIALTPQGKMYNISSKRLMKKTDHIIICHKSNFKSIDGEPIYEADVVDMTMEMPDGSKSRNVQAMVVKTTFGFFSLVTKEGEIPEFDPSTRFIKFKITGNALDDPSKIITYDAAELRAKMEKQAASKIITPDKNLILPK